MPYSQRIFVSPPGPSHPIISTHPEISKNTLFLGKRHPAYRNGLGLRESESLLNQLSILATTPNFVIRLCGIRVRL